MYFSEEEKRILSPIFIIIGKNPRITKYELVMQDDTVLVTTFDTDFDTDNGYELDEEGYEEFAELLFIIQEVLYVTEENKDKYVPGEFLEVTYHNAPKEFRKI